jgi:hypothetical protein
LEKEGVVGKRTEDRSVIAPVPGLKIMSTTARRRAMSGRKSRWSV